MVFGGSGACRSQFCSAQKNVLVTVFVQSALMASTPLHSAAGSGDVDKVREILEHDKYNVNCTDSMGQTPLHCACAEGNLNVVRVLISKYKADTSIQDAHGTTVVMVAALGGHVDIVQALLHEYHCPFATKDKTGQAVLHYACKGGNASLVQTLIRKHKADVNARDDQNNTSLHLAAVAGKSEVVQSLISEFYCDPNVKGHLGRSLLHNACQSGSVNLVQTLIRDHNADVNARDDQNDTPLLLATHNDNTEVVLSLINDFGGDPNIKGYLGKSAMHCACERGNTGLVKSLLPLVLLLEADNQGNTPLHSCSSSGHVECVQVLLTSNASVLIRNINGKSPVDIAASEARLVLEQYLVSNRDKQIANDYNSLINISKKSYSGEGSLTRMFVLGNSGAGKSSLIESLKREGIFDFRLSESSVPLHRVGIVPSIYTSKHYGRSLFYDFSGDTENYSFHAAILENLVSSKKGDNIFIIVFDLREDSIKIKEILYYWLLFIQHQNLGWKKPHLVIIGSHPEKIAREAKRIELHNFCDKIQSGQVVGRKVAYFMLDCRNPRDKQLGDLRKFIVSIAKDSPRYTLSQPASILLGLLEKDFSDVTAFPVSALESHIEQIGIALPRKTQPLHSLLLELHEIGLLFIVNGRYKDDFHVILKISKLTNEVHSLLFSTEAKLRLRESCVESEGSNSSLNIGVIPRNVLEAILPENIPKECLVQLQYCQLIHHKDVGGFSSYIPSDSTDQFFLFFPALCSVDKSEVSWVTPPDLSYSIGWLARCTDPFDYFSPHFLHVLLLRLVFRFTLPAPSHSKDPGASPDYNIFQHRSTILWKTGVHWLEKGVECMVELVNGNKDVKVTTKSIKYHVQNCTDVFSRVISCVMEAKAEFCYSITPQSFLFDCTHEDGFLNEDYMFSTHEVERALAQSREIVISISGKRQMELPTYLSSLIFTHWHTIFPIDFVSVLHLLENVEVDKMFELCLNLFIPYHKVEALEINFHRPTDKGLMRREMVKEFMSFTHHPPCWWHLVHALKRMNMTLLAKEIQRKHSKSHAIVTINLQFSCVIILTGVAIKLQEKLLERQNRDLKPDVEFLGAFAGVVGSKWPSLATTLSLSESEIKEVKREGPTQQDHALQMLKKWASREDATYGQLCHSLKITSQLSFKPSGKFE